jgi:hypothetical protein
MRGAGWRARRRRSLLVMLVALCLARCSQPRDPIVIREGTFVLENQTRREWRQVRVTINDHFTGGVPSLAPGGLMTARLTDFQTTFGQRFDRARQSVFKVRVTAVDASGAPVALSWGK